MSQYDKESSERSNKQTVLSIRDAYRKLSSRESEVLFRLLEGKSNKKIAGALHISEKTVENHITRIGKRLQTGGRGTLRRWLIKVKKRELGNDSTPQNNEGRE